MYESFHLCSIGVQIFLVERIIYFGTRAIIRNYKQTLSQNFVRMLLLISTSWKSGKLWIVRFVLELLIQNPIFWFNQITFPRMCSFECRISSAEGVNMLRLPCFPSLGNVYVVRKLSKDQKWWLAATNEESFSSHFIANGMHSFMIKSVNIFWLLCCPSFGKTFTLSGSCRRIIYDYSQIQVKNFIFTFHSKWDSFVLDKMCEYLLSMRVNMLRLPCCPSFGNVHVVMKLSKDQRWCF